MSQQARRDVFHAIADPTRREILNLLTAESLNLNSIAENFNISRPAVSQQIKILTECGLIVITQQGRERFCTIIPDQLLAISDWLEPFRNMWEEKFNRLDSVLDKLKRENKNNS